MVTWGRAAADRTPQRRLVDDEPHPGRIDAGEHFLAAHPQADPALGLVGGKGAVPERGHGAGIVLGLEQAVHELDLKVADQRRGHLQAQIRLEPLREDVVVLGPPAGRVGLPGQREHARPHLLVGHAVEGEQVLDVPLLEPHPPVLDAADLRPRAADLVPRLVGRDAARLAQAAELVSQHDAKNGRAAAWLIHGWLAGQFIAGLNRTHSGSGNRSIDNQCPLQMDGERRASALSGEAGLASGLPGGRAHTARYHRRAAVSWVDCAEFHKPARRARIS